MEVITFIGCEVPGVNHESLRTTDEDANLQIRHMVKAMGEVSVGATVKSNQPSQQKLIQEWSQTQSGQER